MGKSIDYKLNNDTVTITRYGQNDYDIFWHNGDCSVRGTATDILDDFCDEKLNKVKQMAYDEWTKASDNPSLYVEANGIALTNPWIDDSARFELTDVGAIECWGLKTVLDFCAKAMEVINGN